MSANLRDLLLSTFYLLIGVSFTLQVIFWESIGVIWMTLVVSFLVLPLIDLLIRPQNIPSLSSFGRFCPWVPRLYFLLHFFLLFMILASNEFTSFTELLASGLALGTITGGVGITVAHELMHRPKKMDKLLSKLIMASVLYGHFCVEHIRGHHARVGTPDDPATAKKGQSLYAFFVQSISGTLKHAIKLQKMHSRQYGVKIFSFKNELFVVFLCSLLIVTLVWLLFGIYGLSLFFLQAVWAVLLLEATNYIEHYGLRRSRNRIGKYEAVSHKHSWNSNHMISNWILFHLPWHSHHHESMRKAFYELEHISDAPQMPFGYPAMIVLSFFPFLFLPLMEREIQFYEESQDNRSGILHF